MSFVMFPAGSYNVGGLVFLAAGVSSCSNHSNERCETLCYTGKRGHCKDMQHAGTIIILIQDQQAYFSCVVTLFPFYLSIYTSSTCTFFSPCECSEGVEYIHNVVR